MCACVWKEDVSFELELIIYIFEVIVIRVRIYLYCGENIVCLINWLIYSIVCAHLCLQYTLYRGLLIQQHFPLVFLLETHDEIGVFCSFSFTQLDAFNTMMSIFGLQLHY